MSVNQKSTVETRKKWFQLTAARLPQLILLVLIIGVIGLSSTIKAEKSRLLKEKKQAIATERAPANVVLLQVEPATIQDRINLPGSIEPWEKLAVMSEVSGKVVEILVKEGDRVEKGQVIARIDQSDIRIALNSAKATYELALANQKRLTTLFEQGIIPKADIEKLEAQTKTSKAVVENAELMFSRCTITAPISGVIQRLDAKKGLLLGVSDPVAEILQIDKLKGVVGIPESDVALVRNIKEVPLVVQALNNKEIIGRPHFLGSAPENGARLYRLELAIDNSDNSILPGMFFRATLVKKEFQDAITVPLYTVIKRRDQQYVYVEKNGTAQKLPVELGIIEGWQVQVTSGLSAGSRVVVEGHRDIDPGNRLNIVRVINDPKEVLL